MPVKWYGKRVSEKMRRAQISGVNQTMAEATVHAKNNHDWNNQTGTLEGSINIASPAKVTPNGVSGTWGSQDIVYALAQELGAIIRPKNAKALQFRTDSGQFVTVSQVTIPERPYLRPAADAIYPRLAGNIRRHFEAGVT